MTSLPELMPDVDFLLAMEAEELAATLLPILAKGERQARSDFFAGAIGSYKNSHSHRDVDLDNPDEAHELVMLANHLLRIVDQRRSPGPK
ncbi:MAG: TIGR02391 family protein [Bradyrhizobium sp.]|uniref:TIGR02391 family protein n=1 Tax=Bradyrhizobium sp. TaxID=376 RepID=UPI00272646E9|nr:TIGR02391 family protein [Bradyrhizobium sp.]MDO8399348.1 TIGR02391 family protein [Bradyrhizobium sp.]